MFEGIKEKLTQPVGPLPAFAWVIVAVGGYFGYKWLSNRSGSSSSTTATTVGTSASAVPPSSSDYAALTSQIATLGNQITALQGQQTNPPVSSPPDGGIVTPPWVRIDPVTGRGYNINGPIPGTGSGSFDNPYGPVVVNPGPIVNAAAGAATTAKTVTTTAIQTLSKPAPLPVFSNNTATPTPVSATYPTNNVLPVGLITPSGISLSSAPIPATSINIPATTPTVTTAPATVKPVVQTIRKVTQPSPTKVYSTPSKTATIRVS